MNAWAIIRSELKIICEGILFLDNRLHPALGTSAITLSFILSLHHERITQLSILGDGPRRKGLERLKQTLWYVKRIGSAGFGEHLENGQEPLGTMLRIAGGYHCTQVVGPGAEP